MTDTMASTIQVQPLTCALGAELRGVQLADAAQDAGLFQDIRRLLLTH